MDAVNSTGNLKCPLPPRLVGFMFRQSIPTTFYPSEGLTAISGVNVSFSQAKDAATRPVATNPFWPAHIFQ